jgi:hypothetical protein
MGRGRVNEYERQTTDDGRPTIAAPVVVRRRSSVVMSFDTFPRCT